MAAEPAGRAAGRERDESSPAPNRPPVAVTGEPLDPVRLRPSPGHSSRRLRLLAGDRAAQPHLERVPGRPCARPAPDYGQRATARPRHPGGPRLDPVRIVRAGGRGSVPGRAGRGRDLRHPATRAWRGAGTSLPADPAPTPGGHVDALAPSRPPENPPTIAVSAAGRVSAKRMFGRARLQRLFPKHQPEISLDEGLTLSLRDPVVCVRHHCRASATSFCTGERTPQATRKTGPEQTT